MIEYEVGRFFEWGRLPGVQAGWGVALVGIAVLGCAFFSWLEFRLGWSKRSLWLAILRVGGLVAILIWFLDPRLRVRAERHYWSKVVLLLDTSSSMLFPAELPYPQGGKPDGSPAGGRIPAGSSRWEEAVKLLSQGRLCEYVAGDHETAVYLFDEGLPRLLGVWHKAGQRKQSADESGGKPTEVPPSTQRKEGDAREASNLAGEKEIALGEEILRRLQELSPNGRETRLGDALLHVLKEHQGEALAGIIVLSDGGQNAGTSIAEAVQFARELHVPILTLGFGPTKAAPDVRIAQLEVPSQVRPKDPFPVVVVVGGENWEGPVRVEISLQPTGANGGFAAESQGQRDPSTQEAGRTSGAATEEKGTFQARVEDSFSGEVNLPGDQSGFQEARTVTLSKENSSTAVRFEVALTQIGRYRVVAQVVPGETDLVQENNVREAQVEVVDRPLRVLLLAGGPSRDYQFLRSLLYRDVNVFSAVLLQSAQPGISQEADEVLTAFPQSLEELSEYDCVVAIDPDWRKLAAGESYLSKVLETVERWVAEQGGGLILCAGAVHAGDTVAGWGADPRCETILRLYPVVLRRELAPLALGMYTSSDPWPLQLTLEGRAAPYLSLEPGDRSAEEVWKRFSGVFSCLQAVEAKKGATVLAHFSDPRSFELGRPPIYWAEQFYGAGRVFYIGSPETWRLRVLDERYFERFWSQLIRHVAQGRLHRGSLRLLLTTDREVYFQGDTVFLRVQAWDARMNPLERDVFPIQISGPEGFWSSVSLPAVPGERGSFRGSFLPRKLGEYVVVAAPPDDATQQVQRRFRVELPQLEERQLVRNEPLLRQLAESTGGHYYRDPILAVDPASEEFVLRRLPERTRVEPVLGAALRPTFGHLLAAVLGVNFRENGSVSEREWARWVEGLRVPLDWVLLGIAIFLLSCEWTLRRLWKMS